MAVHTWESKPTKLRADRLAIFYQYARDQGCSHEKAAIFAGYLTERSRQSCVPWNVRDNLMEYVRMFYPRSAKRWTIMHSRHKEKYAGEVDRHVHFWVEEIIPMVWDWIRNSDIDRIHTLSNSHCFLPHVECETYSEFHESVIKEINAI